MTALEVLLLVLGFVFVGLSFLIAEKNEEEKSHEQAKEIWSEKDEKVVSERVEAIVADKAEEITEQTLEQLSHLVNEKIMAIDEFSNQVLEKMEHNHKEVIFMYNMLEEKDKKIKIQSAPKKNVTDAVVKKPAVKTKPAKTKVQPEQAVIEEIDETDYKIMDVNKKIQEMHRSGMSILEISKELGMGQGEVKLVIDLYGG